MSSILDRGLNACEKLLRLVQSGHIDVALNKPGNLRRNFLRAVHSREEI